MVNLEQNNDNDGDDDDDNDNNNRNKNSNNKLTGMTKTSTVSGRGDAYCSLRSRL